MKILTTIACITALTFSVNAQHAALASSIEPSADVSADAKARTAVLIAQLGLNAEQAAQVEDLMVAAEQETADLRARCEKIQAGIDGRYDEAYAAMNKSLTPEQAAKLAELRKAGKVGSAGCHAAGEVKAGCSKEGGAKAGAGCCAGRAHASSAGTGNASEIKR